MIRFALLTLSFLLAGCGSDTPIRLPTETSITGTYDLELRERATITVTEAAEVTIAVEPTADYGLLGSDTLSAPGFVERYPEANSNLYTAKYEVAAQSDGPCGSEPISVALALHRQGDNAIVIGGLSAYCGAGKWHGVPVRVLRLAGDMPLPE